ncbi:hypothetical protein D7B24_002735 [Verticillium nonalfalfae]|uniref:Cytochrome P450-dit2 n=1 Tax=Verticillium nonalfalfae TaxID=1051616 RepID=A0A3M9YFL3_9PEZI|nr:uncharacterized protein D7B24_002735 [Verticillium nonalfalfae]RNJ59357.1 hypothetical protein D7B24_002735 [Verticillium nonalfalfae]
MVGLVLVVAGVLCLGLYQLYVSITTKKKLPDGAKPLPGPMNLPFIGRVHDVPAEGSWLKFHEWGQKYGPIYTMDMFGSTHIWISSESVATDLLSRRSTIYSDRPVIPNLPDNRYSGNYLALAGRNDTWKRQRKLAHGLMSVSAAQDLHAYPTRERDRLLWLVATQPAEYREWIEQFTSRTVARLSWGSAAPADTLRVTTQGLLETISPAGALPNVVSFLAGLPRWASPWKRREAARHAVEEKLFTRCVASVREGMEGSEARPSFVQTFLSDRSPGGKYADVEVWDAMYTVGQMAIAGALTIGSPIQSFLLAMLHFPEWQRKLQEEIETVCEGRCPQWSDRERLPMVRAVVKEVLRWRPPVPTGIPHAVEKDDVYEGYFIPKGATIHALEWSITRDPVMYPDPEIFNPARWLEESYPTYKAPLTTYPNLANYSQFGFGRRTCQGVSIVEQDLFLTMGGLAWAMDIIPKRRPDGSAVPVHWNDFTPLLIAKPAAFEFDVIVRKGRESLLRQMHEEAGSGDDVEKQAFNGQATKEGLFTKEASDLSEVKGQYQDFEKGDAHMQRTQC